MDWFTADTHFGHGNIIRHCDRPFADAQEMDERMLDNINSLVLPSDTLYHLGDFAFTRCHQMIASYRERIRCRRIILILGNHDPQTRAGQPKEMLQDIFSHVFVMLRITPTIDESRQPMILSHYAMRTWSGSVHGSWHLFGHSHGTMADNGSKSFDVGMDAQGYNPVSLEEVTSMVDSGGDPSKGLC